MEKQIKMSLETARSAYKVLMEKDKFTIAETLLSTLLLENFTKEELEGKKWFEFKDCFSPDNVVYFLDIHNGHVNKSKISTNGCSVCFKTEIEAKSARAFAQLTHIVPMYNEGRVITDDQFCYVTKYNGTDLGINIFTKGVYNLPFITFEDAKTSMEVNRQLWLDYWMITEPDFPED